MKKDEREIIAEQFYKLITSLRAELGDEGYISYMILNLSLSYATHALDFDEITKIINKFNKAYKLK